MATLVIKEIYKYLVDMILIHYFRSGNYLLPAASGISRSLPNLWFHVKKKPDLKPVSLSLI
jgi:hypothetical protein